MPVIGMDRGQLLPARRLPPPDAALGALAVPEGSCTEVVERRARRADYVKVGYEIYGQQADIEVLKDYMEREKYHFPLHEVNTPRQGKHSKNDRIERLEPDLRNGRFYLPGIIYHPEIGGVPVVGVDRADKAKNPAAQNVGEIVYRPLKAS
jgi:hypothetical protein